ncbi:hypothetical protein QJS04_geneDACA003327 [Acorus gramineus]|uniref:Uncharacterized protein n=1 Tax=Acorus gramineus TaxID=55184 RepID=A0AAV9BNN0_ACOGR|nr:hypothetical protein QJS04_geneDACA003327 [Acorus gramineus]
MEGQKESIMIARGFTECLHDAPKDVCNNAKEMLDDLQTMKAPYSACGSNAPLQSRSMSIPSSVNVYAPNVSKTKGSGKKLRGWGGEEKWQWKTWERGLVAYAAKRKNITRLLVQDQKKCPHKIVKMIHKQFDVGIMVHLYISVLGVVPIW